MHTDDLKTETHNNGNMMLAAGFLHEIGDFNIIFDEETNQLKIYTFHGSKHLKIRPKTDNCIEVEACYQR